MEEVHSTGAPPRIFLLDTDGTALDAVHRALNGSGCLVEAVPEAEGFLERLESDPPDLVIADMDFPGLPGMVFLEQVSARIPQLPVILTGMRPEDATPAFRRGAADFLRRPLDTREVRERASAALTRRARSGDVPESERVLSLLAEFEREKKEMSDLLKVSSSLDVSSDSKEILKRLTDLAAESMNCEAASIMLINTRERVLEFVVATGEKGQRLETITIPLGEGIAGWVAVNGRPEIVNDTRKDPRFTGKVDQESGFVTRQILAIPMRLEGETIGVLEVINTRDRRMFGEEDLRVLGGIGERAATIIATVRRTEAQQNFYIQTTNIIVRAIEKKDIFSEGHSWKVAELSHKMARAMDLSSEERNDIHFGSLLHDIGKLDLPSILFNKRSLTEREIDILRQHPVRGAKLLEPIILWKTVVPCVLHHHEAWDGSGYPFGRAGDSIPLGARVINLAESFTVMRAANTYKRQLTLKEAVLEVMRSSGKQFDPEIVKVFVSILEKENQNP